MAGFPSLSSGTVPTGTLAQRPAATGSKTYYFATDVNGGQVYFDGAAGTWTAVGPPPASHQATPANPGTTTSTALVMAGCGVLYTPSRSTTLNVTVTGGAGIATAVNAAGVLAAFGTGAAPIHGAAATGTAIGVEQSFQIPAISATFSAATFLCQGQATVVIGTQYWFDLQYATGSAADAVGLYNLTFVLTEVTAA